MDFIRYFFNTTSDWRRMVEKEFHNGTTFKEMNNEHIDWENLYYKLKGYNGEWEMLIYENVDPYSRQYKQMINTNELLTEDELLIVLKGMQNIEDSYKLNSIMQIILVLCCKVSRMQAIREIIEIYKIDPNYFKSENDFGFGDDGPIITASEYGHIEVVKYLMGHGADPSISSNRALYMAVIKKSY